MYFKYSIAISNLVTVRNIFLKKNNLGIINNSVFSEFRINCIGNAISYMRESLLRRCKKSKMGYKYFLYEPEKFFSSNEKYKRKFNPGKTKFQDSSGRRIINPKDLYFQVDDKENIFDLMKNKKIDRKIYNCTFNI
jgi:hypothetical protein